MRTNDCLGSLRFADTDLPTVDETIAAMTLLGRILDELRARLPAVGHNMTSGVEERTLRAEVRNIMDCFSSGPPTIAQAGPKPPPLDTPLDDALLALIKAVDVPSVRTAVRH